MPNRLTEVMALVALLLALSASPLLAQDAQPQPPVAPAPSEGEGRPGVAPDSSGPKPGETPPAPAPVPQPPAPPVTPPIEPAPPVAPVPPAPQERPGVAPDISGTKPGSTSVAEAQAALDWLGFSPGIIDGKLGPRTGFAVITFQRLRGLEPTGRLDPATLALLRKAGGPRLVSITVPKSDVDSLTPIPESWTARSRMKRMDYSTLRERYAERSHVTEDFLASLNPRVDWTTLAPGQTVRLFDFSDVRITPAERLEISLSDATVTVFGPADQLIARFVCSIAADPEKRPLGPFQVTIVLHDPSYTFDPAVWPESGLHHKLNIPPGPNNPVGSTWIGFSRPSYGIHGTPEPQDVGRTGSHGCFRLANWDVERLARMVKPGTPVLVKP